MRLTLRTLLAYLDDALEPAQAKLIGQKVAESEAAQELIGRIKQVTRRRRLTTPPKTGPGAKFDPNTIADYLDNVLPAEQVAELEETCLASDVHLAEVAACHQVLTLFLGEPALVPPTARQRMYGLIQGREAIPNRKVAAPVTPAGAGGPADGQEEETLLGMTLFRRSGDSVQWLVAGTALCLLLIAAIAIGVAVTGVSQPTEVATGPAREVPVTVATAPPSNAQEQRSEAKPPAIAPKTEPQPAQKVEQGALAPREAETPVEGSKPSPPKAAPPSEPPPESKPPVKSPESVVDQAPSTKRVELGKANLVAPTVLLQRPADQESWQRLKPEARVFSNDYLVSLPGYRSEVRLDRGVQLVLWGNLPEISPSPLLLESAIVLHAHPDFDLDLTLDHGRVVLSNQKNGPAKIRLRFEQEVWDLTLPDQNTEVAAELVGICLPYTKEPGGGDPQLHVALLGLKGQAQVKIRSEQHLLRSPSMLTWDNIVGSARSPLPLPRLPEWVTSTVPPKMQAPLEALSTQLAVKNVDVALAEAKNLPDPTSRVLALRCLAAIGNYASLVDCLADDKHPNLRIVAIEELRHLLGLDAKNDDKLRMVLEQKNYSAAQARTIVQLVHGFSREQWADATFRALAVDQLLHEKLAIRLLTHTLLSALEPEGRKIPYDPAGDRASRERGYEAWKKLVGGKAPK